MADQHKRTGRDDHWASLRPLNIVLTLILAILLSNLAAPRMADAAPLIQGTTTDQIMTLNGTFTVPPGKMICTDSNTDSTDYKRAMTGTLVLTLDFVTGKASVVIQGASDWVVEKECDPPFKDRMSISGAFDGTIDPTTGALDLYSPDVQVVTDVCPISDPNSCIMGQTQTDWIHITGTIDRVNGTGAGKIWGILEMGDWQAKATATEQNIVPTKAVDAYLEIIAISPEDADVSAKTGAGDWLACSVGQKLGVDVELHTGPESTVTLRFLDGSTLVVTELTQLMVGTLLVPGDRYKIELLLKLGEVKANVKHTEVIRSDFSLRTPTVVASVSGTVFSVRYDENTGTTQVSVEEGEVLVTPTNPSLSPLTLYQGQQVQVTNNSVSDVAPSSSPAPGSTSIATTVPSVEPNSPSLSAPVALPGVDSIRLTLVVLFCGVSCLVLLGLVVGILMVTRSRSKAGRTSVPPHNAHR